MRKQQALKVRFWSKVEQHSPDECWRGLGLTDQRGRPVFYLTHQGRTTAVRTLYQLVIGQLPELDKHSVRHQCGNMACVKAAHLYLAPRASGVHRSGAKSPTARLTEEQVPESRAAHGTVSAKRLAARYGVSGWAIRAIWQGRVGKQVETEAKARASGTSEKDSS